VETERVGSNGVGATVVVGGGGVVRVLVLSVGETERVGSNGGGATVVVGGGGGVVRVVGPSVGETVSGLA
jgi:hypothetical protein